MHKIEYYPPGKGVDVAKLDVGDIILTRRTDSLMGKAISWLTKGFYCHSASVYKQGGIIAESLEWGVEIEDIEKYRKNHSYAVVYLESDEQDQMDMFEFMESVVNAEENRYGYVICLSLAISILTKHKLLFGAGVGTRICSGFSAETATRSGIIFDKPPSYMTPEDIANHFGVEDPTPVNQKRHRRLANK